MTRRSLLKSILLFAIVSFYTPALWRSEWGRYHILRIIKPRLNSYSQTGILSIGEKETIIAFAEVLIKEKGLSIEERKYIIEHIDYRTQNTPGYLSIYRSTASLLNRLTKSNFSALDLNDRVTVVIYNHKNLIMKLENPDVCIIGTGAAGGIMAWELARRGIKIVIIESGPLHP